MAEVEYAAGLNVQWSYCSPRAKDFVRGYMAGPTPPPAMLFLSSFGDDRAEIISLSEMFPHIRILFRRFYGDNVQERVNPAHLAEYHRPMAGTRVHVILNNEPNFINSIQWHTAAVDEFLRAGIRSVIGSYSVGTPEVRPDFGVLPLARGLFERVHTNPGRVSFGLHEYGPPLLFHEWNAAGNRPENWPSNISAAVELHLMGRVRVWLDYARSIGAPLPANSIFLDEFGFDVIHVPSVQSRYPAPLGPINRNMGLWAGWGFPDTQGYAAAQLRAIWNAVYRMYPEIVGPMVYTYNDTPGIWAEHNLYYAPRTLELIKRGFYKMAVAQTTPAGTPFQPGVKVLQGAPQNFINIRETPNGVDKGDLYNGQTVTVLPISAETVKTAGLYKWQLIEWNGTRYWIALTGSYELVPKMSKAQFLTAARALLDEYEETASD